jgi:hypothetical protein
MYTIIGLGEAGCNLAELFEYNPEYKVKLLDTSIEGENCFSIPQQNSHEEYEKNPLDLVDFFKDTTEKIIFILDGSSKVSGTTLQILKVLKEKKINIFYVRNDVELMNSSSKLQDRVVFNILQEYTRSGVFKSMTLISLPIIEAILGDIPIVEYNKTINKILFNAINTIKKLEYEEAIIDNYNPPKEISRIITYGVYDIEKNIEKLFYPLDFIDDKCYYFGINENELKTNNKLFRIIKESMREKVLDKIKISYRVHSTAHDTNFCYVVAFSRKVQE